MTSLLEQKTASQEARKRVPDFFIVGHPKCGTTALWNAIRRHPEVYMCDMKEPRFFATDMKAGHKPGYPQTLEEYLSLFDAAKPEQRVGEASPSYLTSRTAARAIAEVQPNARIIAILREPASFIYSFHLDLLQRGHGETEKDLRQALANEKFERVKGVTERRYTDHVQYVDQLRRYHAVFAREQVLVLIYDDYRADNEGTLRQVLRFLEVDDTPALNMEDANPTVRIRSVHFGNLTRTLRRGQGPVAGAAKKAITGLTSRRFREAHLYPLWKRIQYAAPRPPDEQLMLELRRQFKPEVVAISEYLGRDLVSLWGYDKVR
ncbi:MAG: sulfotransferase [Actinobacteria bacterium]|nr:MAG: sulfotransferase [Actinomycetota bacterium]